MDPEEQGLLADSVGLALLVVLDGLTPAERIAFVLHDMFDVPFDEIASVVGRSPTAARQLASRARRRVKGGGTPTQADLNRQRQVVAAFLNALRGGDFEGLMAVLYPEVVVRIDEAAGRPCAPREIRGAQAWARGAIGFSQLAGSLQAMLVDGTVELVWAPGEHLSRVLRFTIAKSKILEAEIVADPARLRALRVTALEE